MKVIQTILSLLFFSMFFWAGKYVNLEAQLKVCDSMQNFSAVVFGVIGAWIAIVYPSDFKEYVEKFPQNSPARSRIASLIWPSIFAFIALCYTLVIKISYPALVEIKFLFSHKQLCLRINYAIIGLLAMLLIWSLAACLIRLTLAKHAIEEGSKRAHNEQARTSHTQKQCKN